jgi:hypothetical protein
MAVRLSAPRAGHLYPQEDFWYSFLLEAESTPGAIVRLEGLGRLKNPVTSGIEPANFRLAAQCLNQLRYRQNSPLLTFVSSVLSVSLLVPKKASNFGAFFSSAMTNPCAEWTNLAVFTSCLDGVFLGLSLNEYRLASPKKYWEFFIALSIFSVGA